MDNVGRYHVVLMGDSVLDNFFWLWRPSHDVKYHLNSIINNFNNNNNHLVTNLAVDESTVSDVLTGISPNPVYVASRIAYGLEKYPTSPNGMVYPLNCLESLMNSSESPTHVVLSIGGNDARAAFGTNFDASTITNVMLNNGFVDKLSVLIERIKAICPNIILVYCYHPYISLFPLCHMLPSASTIQQILINFSKIFLSFSEKYSIPVIDLSRTFNPYDCRDYGSTVIEPSISSGRTIAEMIIKVLGDFKFGEDKGKVYAGKDSEYNEYNTIDLISEDCDNDYSYLLNNHLKHCKIKTPCCCMIFPPSIPIIIIILIISVIIILFSTGIF